MAAPAGANSTGAVGASGQNETFYCRNCHAGGVPPVVEFSGPETMLPGAIASFRFLVRSQSAEQPIAGLNVAASGGTIGLVPDQGTRLELGELTHSAPRPNDEGGVAAFEFTWQAPDSEGVYTLFGSGTSGNNDGRRTSDGASRTTFDVLVSLVPPTPTPTPTAPLATPTATASPTPAAGDCPGDCNGDGSVTVDEIITGVNMALGVVAVSVCPAFDANGDGSVTVDEILLAVNRALAGCNGS